MHKVEPEWLSVKSGAVYAEFGQRRFRDFLKQGLRHVRVNGGSIRIKKQWIDEYFTQHEVTANEVDHIVDGVMADLGKGAK